MKVILRIIVYPLVLSLMIVSYTIFAVRNSISFLKYGGEWDTYAKDDKATMQKIYLELKKNKEAHQNLL